MNTLRCVRALCFPSLRSSCMCLMSDVMDVVTYDVRCGDQIVFGGWGNGASAIRKCKQFPNLAYPSTPGLLSGSELRNFWISW